VSSVYVIVWWVVGLNMQTHLTHTYTHTHTQEILCDEKLATLFGRSTVTMFSMNKYVCVCGRVCV
jgi:hypothetical protein